jgi:PfaD family protein
LTNRTTRSDRAAVGSWVAGPQTPRFSSDALREAVSALARPVVVVQKDGRPAVAEGGQTRIGISPKGDALPLLAWVPPLLPEQLGDSEFRAAHRVRAAYVAGEMANGIASEQLVEAICGAGMLGIFGAAGLSVERIEQAMERLEQNLGERPWGVNLIHSPDDPRLEAAAVELFLRRGLRLVSASAYLELTPSVVRYRVAGIHRDQAGAIVVPNRLMAKVSRVEVARKFLEPPPQRFLTQLVESKEITAEQAALAASIPMADDLTAEADSGGHTDNRPLVLLLPALQALRDEVCKAHSYAVRPRIGAAGGLATPASIASAFSMGAAYVVTGSINQGCREAGTSDVVRQMLAQAGPTDVAMAPAADMFEMGVKVQVLTRGTLFAVRAGRLYELYRLCDSIAVLPASVRQELEQKYFRCTLEEAWEGCTRFFATRDPRQLERAAREPKHQLALLFRSYLGQASHWANDGVADRRLDYQVWCGPAMGAFNEWARGSFLESWQARRAVTIARNLMTGAAVLTRVAALRTQGLAVPAELEQFVPRDEAGLDALLTPAAIPLVAEAAPALERASANQEPIAIVGMGGLFPGAENLAAFWRLLRTAQDAVGDIPATHWSVDEYYDADPRTPDKTYAKRGAFLGPHGFDPTEFGIPPSVLEATDTSQLLGLVAARMAMEDAGYGESVEWDRSRASVLLGVTGTQELVISLGARLGHPRWRQALKDSGVDPQTAEQVVERIGRSYVGWQENSFPGLLGNVVAGRIANRLDFGGTNCVIDAACASSLGAVHLAVLELRSNRSDLVLTGGVDSLNDIFMHMCFSKTPALSATGDVRPFSDRADGTLLGEAVGMLVLKRLSDAERDGDRIYATIRGVGTASDGRAKSIYAPLPSGQARALRSAYLEAGVRPRDIDLLEGHGTGTKAGDLAEFEALNQVYREDSADSAWCALGSVKSQVGHTKAAAGAVGMTKAALALHHKVLLPTIKVDAPNPALKLESSPFTLSTQARPWLAPAERPRRAAVSSFGFGGSNFHLVLQEHGRQRPAPAWDGSVELLALSAMDAQGLLAQLREVAKVPREALAAFAATSRERFHATDLHRLVAVIGEEISFATAIEKLEREPGVAFSLLEGIHYGSGPVSGGLAFLFPGQGAQHVNMAQELACLFPEVLEAVQSVSELGSAIYPAATFDLAERKAREERLTRTELAQPAIGVVSRGLLEVLGRFGVKPQFVAGHSYGELVALHAAGVFGAEQLNQISKLRGSLMAGNGEDRGTMLAVLAPLAEVERLLTDEKLEVVLANRNGPAQGVLSGTRAEIARAETACQARALRTARLSVGAAFHSPLVSGAAKAFRDALEAVRFERPRIPVIADATGAPYPADPVAARDLLAQQLALPVKFDQVVERLFAEGARTFVEVGPRSALTGMVRSILGERVHLAVAIDSQSKRGALFDLAQTLARVAVAGHEVLLTQWQRVPAAPRQARVERKAKMSVPLTGANYRAPVAPIAPRAPVAAPVSSAWHEMLQANQEAIRTLQLQQEQTARIHQSFLEGQISAQQNFQALLSTAGTAAPRSVPANAAAPVAEVRKTVSNAVPEKKPVVERPSVDAIATLLEAVAEATGYPRETLDLAMDMEADLGIDSIKRVEILSMLSKRIPGAPSVNPEKLGALRTLQQVADFVRVNPPASVPQAPAVDARGTLLAVVSELTGYPMETLALEMDLEADLGIDSIKRVEILSMLSKRIPGAPSVNPEKLGTLKTLQQVLDFVATAVAVPLAPFTPSAVEGRSSRATLLAVVSELTGYPVETLALEMDLEADLGIDSIKRVEILSMLSKRIPGAPSVNPEKLGTLKTLQQVLDFVVSAEVPAAAAASAHPTTHGTSAAPNGANAISQARAQLHRRVVVPVRLTAPEIAPVRWPEHEILILEDLGGLADALANHWLSQGAKARVIRDATEVTGPIGGLVLLAPEGTQWTLLGEQRLKRGLQLARTFGPRLRQSSSAFFAAISRRDGAFGHTTATTLANPLQGGFAGLVKTADDEWPEVRCRAIDVSSVLSLSEAAAAIVNELGSEGPLEVGLGPAGRTTLALRETEAVALPNRIAQGDLVVVTGGARGVTAECARALAQTRGVSLLLLGRSAAPTAEPEWMRVASDEASLKRALLEHAGPGERPSPKMLGEACRAVLAGREIRASLAALEAGGVKVRYRSVDVRDEAALARTLDEARAELGPVRGLIHGAGVLRDKRIEDKRDDDFDQVLDTKLTGLRSLLEATAEDDLRFIALMASVSGRFGRRGQSDYAVANQALVSVAQAEAAQRPNCRVVALDWGPWDGGMVTPALRAQFEHEGVSLIPLADGARALCEEVQTAPGGPAEIVLGAGFSEESNPAWIVAASHRLDSKTWPVLSDHQLAGKSVLPLALTLEWFAQAAAWAAPGQIVQSLEEVRVLKGVTAPDDVAIWVGVPEHHANGTRLPLELRSGRDQLHVRAFARIGAAPLAAPVPLSAPGLLRPYPHGLRTIYSEQLFHGERLEAIEAIEGISQEGMTLRLRTHPTSERLLPAPMVRWATDPLVVDGVFQALILWCRELRGAPSLPARLSAWKQFKSIPAGTVRVTVRVREAEGAAITSDIDLLDDAGEMVARLEGYVCTVSPTLDRAFHPETVGATPVAPSA